LRAVEPFLILARREVCNEMLKRLPRELRDMVYDYILSKDDNTVYLRPIAPKSKVLTLWMMDTDLGWVAKEDWITIRPHFDEWYSGATVALELREQWHQTATFDLGTHWEHVNPIHTTDVWDYKLDARISITNFVITLSGYSKTYDSDATVARHRATFGKGVKIHVRVYGRSEEQYVRQGPGTVEDAIRRLKDIKHPLWAWYDSGCEVTASIGELRFAPGPNIGTLRAGVQEELWPAVEREIYGRGLIILCLLMKPEHAQDLS
jgi:hypothetical protein